MGFTTKVAKVTAQFDRKHISVSIALPYSSKMGIVKYPMPISTAGINIKNYSLGPLEEIFLYFYCTGSGWFQKHSEMTNRFLKTAINMSRCCLGIKSLERT